MAKPRIAVFSGPTAMIQNSEPLVTSKWAFLGGYELHVKLLQPVRPGDRLRLKLSIGSKRRSSRAGRGHVDSVHVLMRQDDMAVFSVELALLMATRTPA